MYAFAAGPNAYSLVRVSTRCTCGVSRNFHATASSNGQFDDLSSVPAPMPSGDQAGYKKGTAGRSSFSGVVATVFGATGFLGRNVINKLGKIGSQIIIPYRCDPYFCRDLKLAGDLGQVLFYPFHLRDEESIRTAVKHSNLVINMIGRDWETKNFSFDDVHHQGARRIARICREMGVKRHIFISALNANVNPEPKLLPFGSQFLRSKALGEIAVREEFPETVIIRPAICTGTYDRFHPVYLSFWRRYNRSRISMYRKGDETFKMPLYMTDFSAGVIRIVLDPSTDGNTYEFVGPYCYNLGELVSWIFEWVHRGKDINHERHHINFYMTMVTNWKELWKYAMSWPVTFDWELIERLEATSDVLTGCPTLEDLGVGPLVAYEERAQDQLLLHDRERSLQLSLARTIRPPPPPHYPPLRAATLHGKAERKRHSTSSEASEYAYS